MNQGQPALLYLVPSTLGATIMVAVARRELTPLWNGTPCLGPDATRPGARCRYCPSGHELKAAQAEAGRCDGCRKAVSEGEAVMDCRTCNWYLCAVCRPGDAQRAVADA